MKYKLLHKQILCYKVADTKNSMNAFTHTPEKKETRRRKKCQNM